MKISIKSVIKSLQILIIGPFQNFKRNFNGKCQQKIKNYKLLVKLYPPFLYSLYQISSHFQINSKSYKIDKYYDLMKNTNVRYLGTLWC